VGSPAAEGPVLAWAPKAVDYQAREARQKQRRDKDGSGELSRPQEAALELHGCRRSALQLPGIVRPLMADENWGRCILKQLEADTGQYYR
jgi:hypothetical protein